MITSIINYKHDVLMYVYLSINQLMILFRWKNEFSKDENENSSINDDFVFCGKKSRYWKW